MQRVSGSTSTNFGIPPLIKTEFAVDTKDKDGRITSFPLIGISETARFNAAVPLFTATHVSESINLLNFFSNFDTLPLP